MFSEPLTHTVQKQTLLANIVSFVCKWTKTSSDSWKKGHFPRMNHFQSNDKQFGPKLRKRLYFGWKWRRLVVVLLFLYLLSVQPPDLYFTSQTCEYISFFHALLIYFYLFYWYLSMKITLEYAPQKPTTSLKLVEQLKSLKKKNPISSTFVLIKN